MLTGKYEFILRDSAESLLLHGDYEVDDPQYFHSKLLEYAEASLKDTPEIRLILNNETTGDRYTQTISKESSTHLKHTAPDYSLIDLERSYMSDYFVFWNPYKRGYTNQINQAGKYRASEAKEICTSDRDNNTIKVRWDLLDRVLESALILDDEGKGNQLVQDVLLSPKLINDVRAAKALDIIQYLAQRNHQYRQDL
ncbi:hypothetical protein ACQKEX_14535 [Bacillus pumilus]|uniref:hypothetical protein n=1 Tax=Bacillus TaxID=1386 RepID=UPI00095A5696|nr:hypothetical protein [Bacillus pumilus]MBU8576453.1 hypothetical protein [Bacillus pumilus]OLP64347.1 hypothetical protein BACPU_25720 [Bacillus pumilus]